ncbi:MAG: hypothetical protein RSC93_13860, partial [Erysipelotrichaceae bacterium]
PDPVFRNYILDAANLIDNDKNGSLSQTEIAGVDLINVEWVSGEKISGLKGIEYFTAIEKLVCDGNNITSLDLSNNTALKFLECNSNLLTNLDLSKNTNLTNLYCCSNTALTNLNVSNNKLLNNLWCYESKLTSLDVSNNTALKTLTCFGNQLAILDVSKNIALTNMDCADNQLTSLDVSNNKALTSLDCSNQKRTIPYDKNKGYQLSAYDTGFVKGNASKFVGATYNDGTLTGVKFKTPITYDYNTGCKIAGLETPMDVTLTFDEKKDKPTITVGNGTNHQVNISKDMTITC